MRIHAFNIACVHTLGDLSSGTIYSEKSIVNKILLIKIDKRYVY